MSQNRVVANLNLSKLTVVPYEGRNGFPPTVLIAEDDAFTIRLITGQARVLANYLLAAADEADAMRPAVQP